MSDKFKEDTKHINDIEGLFKGIINGKVIEQKVQPLVAAGENNGSEMLKVDVTFEKNGQREVIHAVAKLIPPTEEQMEIFDVQSTFKSEMGFYAEVVPLLQAFQREYGILDVANYFPKLYGGRTTLKPNSDVVDLDAVIMLENLKILGYENIDRRQGFDLDTTKLILQVLANFQATVMGIRKKKPEVFVSQIQPKITRARDGTQKPKDGKERPKFNLQHPLLKPLESILKDNPNTALLIPKVERSIERQPIREIREPWGTIVHNDLWVNNIMLKQDKTNFNDIKLIDFQILSHGSPTIDLIFFLFTSVHTAVLKYHFDKLIEFYYKHLVQYLKKFEMDVQEFSYESFQEEIKKEVEGQLFHAIIMLMNMLFGPKGEDKNAKKSYNLPLACKERIWFVIEEAAKRNWI